MIKTTPSSVNQAYALIVQDENKKSSSVGHFSSGEGMDPTALFTARGAPTRKFGDLYCDYCHMRGHTREQCFKLKFCDHCKFRGHLRETCHQLIGYPADFKGKKKANVVIRNGHSGEPPQSQLSSGYGKQSEQSQLIQGATNHMVGNDKMLNGAQVGNTGSVQLLTGETTKVSSIGTCQLDGGEHITNVLCVPDLLTGNVRAIGKEDDGLYILQERKGQHDTILKKS
ncbi:hypothetical protein KY285_036890 [Solanum tuberosum]|nr:hypothetical protein KY285_036890 [Solanum tuberosum]